MRINLSVLNKAAVGTFLALATILACAALLVTRSVNDERRAAADRAEFRQLGIDLAAASDYLTAEARGFAVTADDQHLTNHGARSMSPRIVTVWSTG